MKIRLSGNRGSVPLALAFLCACVVVVGVGYVVVKKVQAIDAKVKERERQLTNELGELSHEILKEEIKQTGNTNLQVVVTYGWSNGTLQYSYDLKDWFDMPGSTLETVGWLIEEAMRDTNAPPHMFFRIK